MHGEVCQKGAEIIAPVPMAPPETTGLGGFKLPSSKGETLCSGDASLNVGVLHLVPTLEFTVHSEHFPDLVDKAAASEGGIDDARSRGDAFTRAFSAHLARCRCCSWDASISTETPATWNRVVLLANPLPALNDITATELPDINRC
ncbi:hypothetical protein IFM89_026061 [Coptis chinensis]|uniref:Uncharacterized protein n=1 Tax=Coptis chinensis TaxID=261450 RepID=A0A835IEX2_9MAGN|nr:hypothetical protein IFM89_026061 [Coptis chinensis]